MTEETLIRGVRWISKRIHTKGTHVVDARRKMKDGSLDLTRTKRMHSSLSRACNEAHEKLHELFSFTYLLDEVVRRCLAARVKNRSHSMHEFRTKRGKFCLPPRMCKNQDSFQISSAHETLHTREIVVATLACILRMARCCRLVSRWHASCGRVVRHASPFPPWRSSSSISLSCR